MKKENVWGINISKANVDELSFLKKNDNNTYDEVVHHQTWLETEGCDGKRLDYRGLAIEDCTFENLILNDAIMIGASAQGVNFSCSQLENVNFTGANLESADFSFANLKGAILLEARLDNAKFNGADISGAILSLNNITMDQLGQCKYTPELAAMIQTKFYLSTFKKNVK